MDGKEAIAIIMQFEGGAELILKEHSTIDISRTGTDLHINVTNTNGDLAFNGVYDRILELSGESKIFNIVIQQGRGSVPFAGVGADYHVNALREILHFTKKQVTESKT